MTSINTSGLSSDLYWQEEKVPTGNQNGQLTQEDFFSLLTEQLSNQDPTKPVDNDQMIAQMTSFTMADSLSQLNSKFDEFATNMTSNQALQASSLIGQRVLLQGSDGTLQQDGTMTAMVISGEPVKDMKVSIENSIGQVVRVINLGDQQQGNIEFNWDGKDQSGNLMPPGNYRIRASGNAGGEGIEIPTAIYHQVSSVSLASSSQGVVLNLYGNSSVKLSDVIEIGG
ncbi:flagellar hook assembly protein FlgD [Bowmanella sp. JS7-9]|uniref:Basal-body rod modification protein FlgD n=1 Tax=Pseudobowmanella zhangzhouensis TaxID=1537679 RepID=A0ABW1XKG5_9ALTE|nr:flagellar hook assembly protein FlgD [Bowmanella sp. JS7-9]TBX22595.1 flagellar basal body rod modification protein FlgD [Bowmanella sp. JS7-9]